MRLTYLKFTGLCVLGAVVMALGSNCFATAEKPHDMMAHIKVLQSVDVTTHVSEPMKSTTLTVEFMPGEAHPPHRHPGAVFGYVLEGTLEFAIDDQPVRTLKAGDTFHEPTMALHRVGRNPDSQKNAKILVVMLHPRDAKELVILEPVKDGAEKEKAHASPHAH